MRKLHSKLHGLLHGLLRQGAGEDALPVESELSREADLAEAVIETYEVTDADLLKGLDDRLPTELRQRIEELDLEAESKRRPIKE